jgi:hypothetical protein
MYIEVITTIENMGSFSFSSGYGEIRFPTASTSTTSTTISVESIERNINLTPDYPSDLAFTDFNGVSYAYSPNTAYIKVTIGVYVYDLSNNKSYINVPSNLKIKFTNTPVIKARCKSKVVTFNKLNGLYGYKAVLPFRFGLSSEVTALSVDKMYLYGHVPTDDGSSFTKVTLASHTGLSNTGKGDYKKYLDYIVIDPNGTLTPEKFVNTSSYASFSAGTTTGKRTWNVYLVAGSATDFNNVSSGNVTVGAKNTQATSINEELTNSANGSKLKLANVIRDNWGVMLQVMS